MATLIGQIGEFDCKREEWPQYAERLDHFLAANSITEEDKKRSILLTVIGPETYKLLRSLSHPAKPGEKTYADLVARLTAHFKPTPSETVQCYKFQMRSRAQGESVAEFVADLRSIAEFCNYGDTLDEMLRDQIVLGINNPKIQIVYFRRAHSPMQEQWSLHRAWK